MLCIMSLVTAVALLLSIDGPSADALLLFARLNGNGAPLPIDVENTAKVRDVAERIRCYLAITGLSSDSIRISYGGDILEPSLSLAEAAIGAESEMHYQILPFAVRNLGYSLRSSGLRCNGIVTCNQTFHFPLGGKDFLGELEQVFKRWLIENDERAPAFMNVPVRFRIYYVGLRANHSSLVSPGLSSKTHFIVPLIEHSGHCAYAISSNVKAVLVSTQVIDSDDPIIGNRMITERFEQIESNNIVRLHPKFVDQSRRICQLILEGPIAVSQLSPISSVLCPEERAGMDLFDDAEWATHPEIALYLDIPFGYDLVLL